MHHKRIGQSKKDIEKRRMLHWDEYNGHLYNNELCGAEIIQSVKLSIGHVMHQMLCIATPKTFLFRQSFPDFVFIIFIHQYENTPVAMKTNRKTI